MTELTSAQVRILAESLRLPVSSDDEAEVTHRLNAFVDILAPLADLPLQTVEPLPALPDDDTLGAADPPPRKTTGPASNPPAPTPRTTADDLAFLSATQAAALLRRREISPVELADTY